MTFALLVFLFPIIWQVYLYSLFQKYEETIFSKRDQIGRLVSLESKSIRKLNEKFQVQMNCSPELIKNMRNIEFSHIMLKDIGFIKDDKLLCSTRLGIIKPHRKIPPFIVNKKNSDQYYNPAFNMVDKENPEEIYPAIKIGRFIAIFNLNQMSNYSFNWLKSQTYLLTKNNHLFLYGDIEILEHSPKTKETTFWLESGYYKSKNCNQKNVCTLIQIDIGKYFETHPIERIIGAIILILISILSSSITLFLSDRYSSLNNQLKCGLSEKRIQCFYQPVLNIKTGSFDSVEVLCRWLNEDKQLVFPDVFIPKIIQNKQQQKFTQYVFKKAIKELNSKSLLKQIHCALNFFPSDLSTGNASKLLKELPIGQASQITVEITEQLLDDLPKIIQETNEIQSLGSCIAIDDFGTGYSNLRHIEKLNIDILKIDRSFIYALSKNSIQKHIVDAISRLATELNIKVIAEGVEDESQLAQLRALNIDYSQGFLHAKPMPIGKLKIFLDESRDKKK